MQISTAEHAKKRLEFGSSDPGPRCHQLHNSYHSVHIPAQANYVTKIANFHIVSRKELGFEST